MAEIIIKIKDGFELKIAKKVGYQFDEDNPPSPEEAIANATIILEERYYKSIWEEEIKESPVVKAKEAELEAVKAAERAKFEDAKLQEAIKV